jgi:sensor c-di-GMP phosphodiesterase-like protein
LLREQDFRISIDDFGTGYSSLSHLNQMMAHELKIDRYFLNGIPGDAAAEKLYLNIIDLAKRFELTIVSEGVETQEQLQFIQHHGCHYYQGYLYSPAIPTGQFVELLRRKAE